MSGIVSSSMMHECLCALRNANTWYAWSRCPNLGKDPLKNTNKLLICMKLGCSQLWCNVKFRPLIVCNISVSLLEPLRNNTILASYMLREMLTVFYCHHSLYDIVQRPTKLIQQQPVVNPLEQFSAHMFYPLCGLAFSV